MRFKGWFFLCWCGVWERMLLRQQGSTYQQSGRVWPSPSTCKLYIRNENSAGIFKQSVGARNQVGIGLSYRTVAELVP
jgi:hypothetical protein